ncbi:MAG: GxxExxY protein [Acidobacteria bacterium]|nr:GxxExxY protein [Acidobacteriota bacterium]
MIKEPDNEVNQLATRIIGIAIDVHKTLGAGYMESIYENALSREFEKQGVPFLNQYPIEVVYKGFLVGEGRLDFLIDKKLILEIKAVSGLAPVHFTQLRSYLKAMDLQLGLLINFNEARLADGIRRVVFTPQT